MFNLILVSLIWAFSFGMIKKYLAGLDPSFVAGIRLTLSLLVFLPFLRPRGIDRKKCAQFFILGGVQFGLMYVAYLASFRYLYASQVVLLTVFTPIFVTLLEDWRRGHFHKYNLATALLAVIGAAVIVYDKTGFSYRLTGFLLVQASNLCFAFGQVFFRSMMRKKPDVKDHQVFAIFYLGALAVVMIFWLLSGSRKVLSLNSAQLIVLLYLGIIASGLGFFLWNHGALRVSAGTLAVLNNLKIPLGVACSLLVFGEKSNLTLLLGGGGLISLALFWNALQEKKNLR